MSLYEIKQELLDKYNRPRTPLKPQGLTLHDTEGHNDTDEGNYSYFNGGDRSASAHYFADWDSISQFIPDNEEAWHAGYNANIRYLSLELCHTDDAAKFAEIWKRGVWLVASKCIQYGWSPSNPDQVMTHHMVSDRWHETSHTDPDGYFQSFGKTFADFVKDVEAMIEQLKRPEPNPAAAPLGTVKVVSSTLNVRVQPTTTAAIARPALKQGDTFKFWKEVNGWYNLGGNQWAYGNNGAYLAVTSYSKPNPAPAAAPAPTPAPKPAPAPAAPAAAPAAEQPQVIETKVNILVHSVKGGALSELTDYLNKKGWWDKSTANADGSQEIEVGIFIANTPSYYNFIDFITTLGLGYSIKPQA